VSSRFVLSCVVGFAVLGLYTGFRVSTRTTEAIDLLGPLANPNRDTVDLVGALGEQPIRLACTRTPKGKAPTAAIDSFSASVRPTNDDRWSASRWLHLVRVFGLELAQDLDGKNVNAADLFTDTELGAAYFGAPLFVRTSHGLRFSSSGKGRSAILTQEVHRDQCLAVMAELGVPLATTFRGADLGGRLGCLGDVLNDSIANFHLSQDELPWTAVALALYLPPSRSWANKFGESFTFDQLATELMSRPLADGSCAGIHLAGALTTLYRVDEQRCILSESTRAAVESRVQGLVAAALRNQLPDGSWSIDWHSDAGVDKPGDTPRRRLLATGHVAEWLMATPACIKVPQSCLERATGWLLPALLELTPEECESQFCPVSHALIVLRSSRTFAPSAPTSSNVAASNARLDR
jgi:hypothetical protein